MSKSVRFSRVSDCADVDATLAAATSTVNARRCHRELKKNAKGEKVVTFSEDGNDGSE